MSDDSRYSKGGKYYDSSRELHDDQPLINHSLNRKYGTDHYEIEICNKHSHKSDLII